MGDTKPASPEIPSSLKWMGQWPTPPTDAIARVFYSAPNNEPYAWVCYRFKDEQLHEFDAPHQVALPPLHYSLDKEVAIYQGTE